MITIIPRKKFKIRARVSIDILPLQNQSHKKAK